MLILSNDTRHQSISVKIAAFVGRTRVPGFILLLACVSCSEPRNKSIARPIFLVDRVSTPKKVFTRSEMPQLPLDGSSSASVTLEDETERALLSALPSRFAFSARLSTRPLLQFTTAVSTLSRVTWRFPVEFRIGVNRFVN